MVVSPNLPCTQTIIASATRQSFYHKSKGLLLRLPLSCVARKENLKVGFIKRCPFNLINSCVYRVSSRTCSSSGLIRGLSRACAAYALLKICSICELKSWNYRHIKFLPLGRRSRIFVRERSIESCTSLKFLKFIP